MSLLNRQAQKARQAWLAMQSIGSDSKNRALECVAVQLECNMEAVLKANRIDLENAAAKGMDGAMVERLTLNRDRIQAMADSLRDIVLLPDPIGEIVEAWERPNGLEISKVRVPIGVIGIIYESRPNVTVDAAALCLKSGNAVILRGGSDAFESNKALMELLQAGVREANLPEGCVSLVMDTSRETAAELMTLNDYLDLLIPRGGKGLIRSVVKNATVPVIQTGDGVCHVDVDGRCDLSVAKTVAVSAKVSRPSVCNAAETLLVDAKIAQEFLLQCLPDLREQGVEIRGDEGTKAICPWVNLADDSDWAAEYNDAIYAVKIVDGVQQAVEHINRYGTRHSEAIITSSAESALFFKNNVDAAAVYHNVSTRFTDGGEFGFGAEIGISTQKLHARGPMGLRELTTTKYLIEGNGQIR